jgi:translation initiation factor IF-2
VEAAERARVPAELRRARAAPLPEAAEAEAAPSPRQAAPSPRQAAPSPQEPGVRREARVGTRRAGPRASRRRPARRAGRPAACLRRALEQVRIEGPQWDRLARRASRRREQSGGRATWPEPASLPTADRVRAWPARCEAAPAEASARRPPQARPLRRCPEGGGRPRGRERPARARRIPRRAPRPLRQIAASPALSESERCGRVRLLQQERRCRRRQGSG